ncbi:MAG: DUF3429 domain-containing protein [Pseudomonadota bacterium]
MTVPRSALILGLAGLIPFFWGALTLVSTDLAQWSIRALGPRFVGPYVQLSYGTIILAFMSGVLWGFATKTKGAQAAACYTLSVIPALWAFFMVGSGPVSSAINLMTGFAGLLALDYMFWQWKLAPAWWMQLRVLLTALVIASLAVTAFI